MANAESSSDHKYDFTEDRYREAISLAKKNYQFARFTEIDPSVRQLLWRHDVDISVHRALRCAQIECDEGVSSSFFIHLHSEFYHWSEARIAEMIREIRRLGHEIALHFDIGFYGDRVQSQADLTSYLRREKQYLEDEFEQPVRAFSFHNPDVKREWLQFDDDEIAGMINAYGKGIRGAFAYCSDSNGYWRYQSLFDVLMVAEQSHLQVLTHPGWWTSDVLTPRDRVVRAVKGRAKRVMANYDALLNTHNRTNIGIDP